MVRYKFDYVIVLLKHINDYLQKIAHQRKLFIVNG